MPKQIKHWMGLVWKKCPVSNLQRIGKKLNEQVPIWNGQKGTRILTKKSAFEYMPVTDSCPISANLNKQITLVSNSNYFLKIPHPVQKISDFGVSFHTAKTSRSCQIQASCKMSAVVFHKSCQTKAQWGRLQRTHNNGSSNYI